jgi:hypothetical protein
MPRSFALHRVPLLLGALVTAPLIACGGADGAATAPAATPDSTIDGPAPAPTVASEGGGALPLPLPGVASPARYDGLTGAPVPAPASSSVEFDEGRLRENAGRFPPLDDPVVVSAAQASWMRGDDLVLGATRDGEARAYPLFMMTFHHVANDELAGKPYLVTF